MNTKQILALCAVGMTGVASAVNVVGDANAKTMYLKEKTVITMTQSGTLTVTEPGEIEVLIVGGGGGGGGLMNSDTSACAGGGGAGGVIHRTSLTVTAKDYPVTIGLGGTVWNTGVDESAARGKQTEAFGFIAYGGGPGARALNNTNGGRDGASGGGNSSNYGTKGLIGKAIYTGEPYLNLGHDGGDAAGTYGGSGGGGGGGGAGSAANGPKGGDGYACSITGSEVYYAGGGGGYADDTNGLGGGNGCYGGGGRMNRTGGNGVVIVSFVRSAGSCSEDFALSGGNSRIYNSDSTVVTFTENGTLTIAGDGILEMLIVGGGGGGGDKSGSNYGGGGGGAGGLMHLKNIPVVAGTYAVTVGVGGAIGENGQDSTALGFTAYGGGYGAGCATKIGNGGDGGCGGGASSYYSASGTPIFAGGKAAYGAEGNIGCGGGNASNYSRSGGGGGAGGLGANSADYGNGGIGYVCDITGASVYYAGGGGGYNEGGAGGGGKPNVAGTDGLGGGGGANAKGGSGIVIFRVNKKGYEESFNDATGGKTRGFTRGDKHYRVHTFSENGTFVLPHAAKIEALLVGGGGGGGSKSGDDAYAIGAGGGGGGVIHKETLILEAGSYDIVIGAGGVVNTGVVEGRVGGDTIMTCLQNAFSLTAKGGGCGAKGQAFTSALDGASGGGGTKNWSSTLNPSKAIYTGEPYLNLGHDGGAASSIYNPGGGGGAGAAADGINGGDGYPCSISGSERYYAGGGGGSGTDGLGADNYGGGGRSGKAGQQGVVIICHEAPRTGFFLVVK